MFSLSIQKQYDNIASIYDLLSEGDDGSIYFRLYAEKVLKTFPKGSIVLDCSCGTGDHAIWLARQGYRVFASDISDGMIAVASKKAEKEEVSISFFRSSWEELPGKTEEKFDMVFCPGNSISHMQDLEMLKRSFKSIRKVLKPGGKYFFDLRNWEKTFEENNLPPQEFEVNSKGRQLIVKYSWDIKGWNTQCKMFVDTHDAKENEYKQYVFDFFPLGYYQLHDALLEAGFESVERGFFPDDNYYFAIAK